MREAVSVGCGATPSLLGGGAGTIGGVAVGGAAPATATSGLSGGRPTVRRRARRQGERPVWGETPRAGTRGGTSPAQQPHAGTVATDDGDQGGDVAGATERRGGGGGARPVQRRGLRDHTRPFSSARGPGAAHSRRSDRL